LTNESLSKTTKNILNRYGITLNKNLGQNYLIDRNKRDQIINFANLTKEDVVLEIGTGIGTLTIELAKKAGKVIAIEQDTKIANILSERLKEGSFRQGKLSECLHWGKAPGIPGVSALWYHARADTGMPTGRKCGAVPEECRSRRSVCRRLIDALPKGGNNPECRGVVPAGERWIPLTEGSPFTGRLTSRFPVKPRKGCIRRMTDPGSGMENHLL
jgi:hypothetical protein